MVPRDKEILSLFLTKKNHVRLVPVCVINYSWIKKNQEAWFFSENIL